MIHAGSLWSFTDGPAVVVSSQQQIQMNNSAYIQALPNLILLLLLDLTWIARQIFR